MDLYEFRKFDPIFASIIYRRVLPENIRLSAFDGNVAQVPIGPKVIRVDGIEAMSDADARAILSGVDVNAAGAAGILTRRLLNLTTTNILQFQVWFTYYVQEHHADAIESWTDLMSSAGAALAFREGLPGVLIQRGSLPTEALSEAPQAAQIERSLAEFYAEWADDEFETAFGERDSHWDSVVATGRSLMISRAWIETAGRREELLIAHPSSPNQPDDARSESVTRELEAVMPASRVIALESQDVHQARYSGFDPEVFVITRLSKVSSEAYRDAFSLP